MPFASAARELRQLLGPRANDAAVVRDHHSHGESYHTPAAPDVVCFPHTTDEVAAIVRIAPNAPPPHRAVRRRDLARRARQRVLRRNHDRSSRNEQGRAGERRRSRRDRRGRRHSPAIEQGAQQHRPDVPGRSRRRRDHRRHDRDARVGHDRGALRNDARERARAHRGAGRRQHHPDRHARAQVVGRLRPDPSVRRLRGNAWRDDRDHAAAAPSAGGCVGGGLLLRIDPGRRGDRDRDDSTRRPGRAHRAARRSAARCRQPVLEDVISGGADVVLRVPQRQRTPRRRSGGSRAGARRRARRARIPVGDAPRRSRAAVAGAARRAVRGACSSAGIARMDDGRVRPHLASRGVRRRDEARERGRLVSDLLSSVTPATETFT